MENGNLLAKFGFFSDIPSEKLSLIAEKCRVLNYDASNLVFRFGEVAQYFYGILDGEVELSIVFKDKVLRTEIEYEEAIRAKFEFSEKAIVIETLSAGEVFGWSSMVKPGRWTATAKCSKPARLFALPALDFKALLEQDTALGYRILGRINEVIAHRLQNRTERLIEAWGQAFAVTKI